MKRKERAAESRGQVLAIAIVILLIISTMVPLMVFYVQREAVWTAKQAANTAAFHLAEAGTEKAYLVLSISTLTWVNLQNGQQLANYKFDKAYTDLAGGSYTISITSGPGVQQATVISIGRDPLRRETRALKVVYSNSPLGGIAIYSGAGAQLGGQVQVEWGAVVSPQSVNTDSRAHPQFWSASSLVSFDTDPNLPNCDGPDCCQWHAYAANIPPNPIIDLSFYKSSATYATGCPAGGVNCQPAGNTTCCYYNTDQTWGGGGGLTIGGGKTVYIDGNLTLNSPGLDHVGNLIVMGNLSTTSGNFGKGDYNFTVPRDAWKQYCHDWSFYKTTFDGGASAAFPGLNSSYQSSASLTYNPTGNKTAVVGLLYVQGSFSVGGGGGGSEIYGVMYVLGTSTMTSNSSVTLYYNKEASSAIQTSQIVLSRQSWQDVLYDWPAGL